MNFKLEDAEDRSLIAVRTKVKRDAARQTLKVVSTSLANTALALVVVLGLWMLGLWAFNVTPFIGKGPLDVFNYLFVVENAAEHQELVMVALGQTMYDAAIGFSFGLLFALIVSILFTLSRSIEQALMPIAMLLRSVPLIAMAPILILIFGREQVTVAVMGAIVVLFLDVTKTFGVIAVTGWEVNLTTIVALLTLIGYSVNDKVVVYDRIREHLRAGGNEPLADVIDRSLNQVLARCIFTSGTTLAALLPMAIWGGPAVAGFAWPMIAGVVIATGSSLFVSGPVLAWLAARDPAAARGSESEQEGQAKHTPGETTLPARSA